MLLETAFNFRHLHFFSIYTLSQACPALRWSLDTHLGLLVQTDAISRAECFVLVPLAGIRGCLKMQHVTGWKTLEHAREADPNVQLPLTHRGRAGQTITAETECRLWVRSTSVQTPNPACFQHTHRGGHKCPHTVYVIMMGYSYYRAVSA